jgi:hypothetical protein
VKHKFCFLAIFMALGSASYAGLVTSLPGGTIDAMPADNDGGVNGPIVFDGITWTATGDGVGYFGYTSSWGFGGNGSWTGALGPMAGVNDETDSMTFAPSSPVSGIGGFLNYVPGETATIAVYNASNALIESDTLSFTTSGANDTGEFLGFSESTPDIAYFTLTGGFIGLTDLTVETSAVPEPGTIGMTLAGLGLLMLMRKRIAPALR